MQITMSQNGDVSTQQIDLAGRFDAHEAADFRERVDQSIAEGLSSIRVVLSDVDFVDSTALAELIRGMKHCREQGGDLVLVTPSDPVRVILELTKLNAAFTIL